MTLEFVAAFTGKDELSKESIEAVESALSDAVSEIQSANANMDTIIGVILRQIESADANCSNLISKIRDLQSAGHTELELLNALSDLVISYRINVSSSAKLAKNLTLISSRSLKSGADLLQFMDERRANLERYYGLFNRPFFDLHTSCFVDRTCLKYPMTSTIFNSTVVVTAGSIALSYFLRGKIPEICASGTVILLAYIASSSLIHFIKV